MSATIILIMTSSSTRNTEPPGGRVAIMIESLPIPSVRFAKNGVGCNANVREHPYCRRCHAPSRGPLNRIDRPAFQRQVLGLVPGREQGVARNLFLKPARSILQSNCSIAAD